MPRTTNTPSVRRPRLFMVIILVGLLAITVSACATTYAPMNPAQGTDALLAGTSDSALARAFTERTSGIEVQGRGTVSRLLRDDDEGGKHQRFIITLDSGQTILIAHNVDVAPRVQSVRIGDTVSFKGEYEWNAQGGVIHWTHHDPVGRHTPGWIEHNGRTYK